MVAGRVARGASPLARPSASQAVSATIVALVGIAGGLTLLAVEISRRPVLAAAGLALVGFCAVGVCAVAVRRRLPRGVPVPRLDAVGEEPAILFPRWRGSVRLGAAGLTLLGATSGLLAIACLSGPWVPAVPLGAFAVYCWVPVLYLTLARWRLGGVWLTPTRLVHESLRMRNSVAWEDVIGVEPGPDPVIAVARTDAHPRRWWRRRSAPPGRFVVDYADLVVAPGALLATVEMLAGSPEARARLGTPESLAQIDAAVRGRDGTRYVPNSDPVARARYARAAARGREVVALAAGAGIALAAILRAG